MLKNKGLLTKIRSSRSFKGLAALLMLSIFFEIVQPTVSLALTEGPSQPEVQSFEPIGTTDMVDVFSGDFNYNIPLFNLPGPNGGYPINLAYHAGVSMDDEASWVGLGWNINPGSLVRNMRGLPDEFKSKEDGDNAAADGDFLEVKSDMKKNTTFGASFNNKLETVGADLTVSAKFSSAVYYNNFRGLGISMDAGVTWGAGDVEGGVGLSLDSDNGVGVNAKLGLKNNNYEEEKTRSLTFSFDGKLSIDYSVSVKRRTIINPYENEGEVGRAKYLNALAKGELDVKEEMGSGGSSISFARSAFSPSLAYKMNKWNASVSMYGGTENLCLYYGFGGSVFFNTEDMKDEDIKGRKHLVVGYDNFGDVSNPKKYSKDFSRERDGQVTATTPYLPVSNYTYDTYNSTGQGLSGYFRPHRNDVGRVHDPELSNNIYGGSLSIDLGAGSGAKVGVQVNLNYGHVSQGAWDDNNELAHEFKLPYQIYSASNKLDENLYYKAHGESTLLENTDINYKFDLERASLKFAPKGTSGSGTTMYGGKRHLKQVDFDQFTGVKSQASPKREKRNTAISNLKNSEVANLGEFNFNYYDWTNLDLYAKPNKSFASQKRTSRNQNHYAGFKVLNGEGAHYVYALPAYNNVEVENLFSTKKGITGRPYTTGIDMDGNEVAYKQYGGGHKFIKKVKKSPYAHSYLLTSVQGADYVDLKNDGPSDDDLGYWVKFSYVNKANNYKWRMPYDNTQAFFSTGASYTDKDDKASYSYGEKELWYMGRMETKTHVAIFQMSPRKDMLEAKGEFPNATNPNPQTGLRLDKILVYDKQSLADFGTSARPLQEIEFTYSYQLCNHSPNSVGENGYTGKLTLKTLTFKSNGSSRGGLNKYEFDYNEGQSANHANPFYVLPSNDSWGNYKPNFNEEFGVNFPYVNQFNQAWPQGYNANYGGSLIENKAAKEVTRLDQARMASAWSLKKIKLPSGGVINVEYESDDYGYVQHKTANQMFKIVSMGKGMSQAGKIYDNKDDNFEADVEKKRIYFKLEQPIPTSKSTSQIADIIFKDYIKPIHEESGERYLYFKTKMKLTDNVHDYVSGYLGLENAPVVNGITCYGVATTNSEIANNAPTATVDGVACYTHGYLTLKSAKKIRKPSEKYTYHPMAIAGWTYLQTNAPDLFQDQGGFSDDVTESNLLGKIGAFLNVLPEMLSSWGGVKSYCAGKKFCNEIDLSYSCMRLASPDKIKFGGGHRVKEISISDNWGTSTGGGTTDNRTYGQHYDYTIEEGGKVISSGVAAYEPQAGGDENALKYPYFYAEKQNYFTKNNLFTEAPYNESLFPAASVGYRKITVSSINTNAQVELKAASGAPTGRVAGITEHYFYTAKEFPTMVEASQLKEENSTLDCYNLLIPIPLIGSLKYNYYHGTQAFKIELNDMHGRPKAVKSFEVSNYEKNPNPIQETSYEYLCEPVSYMGEQVWKLVNEVSVIQNNDKFEGSAFKVKKGIDVDLFTDQRESKAFHVSAGLAFNVDVPPIPILAFLTVWPSYSSTKQLFRTYVTNKVIHRSGILKKTISRDLQSSNESEIMAYDEISGNPIMVRTKNEFGDDFYKYDVPAYYKYDLMGHAYKNLNLSFKTKLTSSALCYYTFAGSDYLDYLVRGDELLVNGVKTYFLGWDYDASGVKGILHAPFIPISGDLNSASLKVIRSGRRNHYSTIAGSYLTKGRIQDIGFNDLSLRLDDNTTYTGKSIKTNALAANASLFMDTWRDEVPGVYQRADFIATDRNGNPRQTSAETFTGDDIVNPYVTGNAGIWRSYKSYSYVGKRKSSALFAYNSTDADPKLYDDGIFDEAVPLFNWNLGLPEEFTGGAGNSNPYKNWEWMNEITRFNTDAYETENVNRLGVYSSALYGYNNSLAIGVGGNASLHEIGVMDFETLEPKAGATTVPFGKTMKENGLNFYNDLTNVPKKVIITENKNFWKSVYSNGKLTMHFRFSTEDEKNEFVGKMSGFTTSLTYPAQYQNYQPISSNFENTFGISLVSKASAAGKGNQSYHLNGTLYGNYVDNSLGDYYAVQYDFTPYVCAPQDVKAYLVENTWYYGKLTMFKKRHVANVDPGIVSGTKFVKSGTDGVKAHSGKMMMKINGSLMFEQQKFCFLKNKSYILSVWVSRTNQDVKTYETSNLVQPIMIDPINLDWLLMPAPSSTQVIYTYGKVIEGWQKVDIEFKNDGTFNDNVFAIRFNTGGAPLYVDDVRLSPKTGGMKTFVYDPVTFWLKATLNMDNYATFYHYNEQGALKLTKQETEKGIFTVSESRSRLKK